MQLPETTDQPQTADPELTGDVREAIVRVHDPSETTFAAGSEATVAEVLRFAPRGAEDPLLSAVKLAVPVLLTEAREPAGLEVVADGVADFYRHCELWNPDALGPGEGWYTNMWVRCRGMRRAF